MLKSGNRTIKKSLTTVMIIGFMMLMVTSNTYAPQVEPVAVPTLAPAPTPAKSSNISLSVDKAVEGILINDTDITLKVGEDRTISATISPEDATNKSVSWSSSDSYVASVSDTGVITAKKGGTIIITAKAYNGKTHSITLSVNEPEESIVNASSKDMESDLASTQEGNESKPFYFMGGLGLIGAVYGYNHFKKKGRK